MPLTRGRDIINISTLPKSEIFSARELSCASLHTSAVIWTINATESAFISVGIYWYTGVSFEISLIKERIGCKISSETTETRQEIVILTNREYSVLIFLKTTQTTNAHRTIPHIFISFILKIENRRKHRQ